MSSIVPLWDGFEPFQHQLFGIQWMLQKETTGTLCTPRLSSLPPTTIYGGLQCDDMGLGKTIQMLATIKSNPKPITLLLAPLAMIDTWTQAASRSGFRVFLLLKGSWSQADCNSSTDTLSSIYITNFEQLLSHRPLICSLPCDRLVLDEAHKIRNPDSILSILCRKIHAPIRWAMTGTPLVNSRKDVVALFAFLGVPVSPTWKWETPLDNLLPLLIIHRSLDQVRDIVPAAPPVPDIQHVILPFISSDEEQFYRGIQGDNKHLLKMFERDLLDPRQKFLLLIRLRQMSVHPQVYINAKRREPGAYYHHHWDRDSTKIHALKRIIREQEGHGHKFIVFCQFIDEMTIIRDSLLRDAIAPSIELYHGGLSLRERSAVLQRATHTPDCILLIQLQCGGVGLNLQQFDRCVFISPWWTSAMTNQAIARCVRIGQSSVVRVYFLTLFEETSLNIDQFISHKATHKSLMLSQLFQLVCSTVS